MFGSANLKYLLYHENTGNRSLVFKNYIDVYLFKMEAKVAIYDVAH